MFGDLFGLQNNTIVSIGHGFAVMALVVSGPKELADRMPSQTLAARAGFSDRSVRTA
jgi:hypothetical protein